MIVRIFEGITTHFPARRSEWIAAGGMMLWGFLAGRDPEFFSRSPSYDHMAAMASSQTWAFWTFVIGAGRWIALTINGSFAATIYSRYSPHTRMLMSGASCFLWMQLTLGFLGTGSPPPGIALYIGAVVTDYLNILSAAGDVGKARMAAKNVTS